jgi:hypothetical protein
MHQQVKYWTIVRSVHIVFIWEQTAISFPIQHKLICFYNLDEKCLLRGKNWVFH